MDIATLLGFLLGFGLVLGSIVLGNGLGFFIDVTSMMIVFGGTIGAALIAFPMPDVIALLSALFHEQVTALTLVNGPQSWLEWTQTPWVSWPTANFLRGVLAVGDLTDCVRVVRERVGTERVQVIEPWGPAMQAE